MNIDIARVESELAQTREHIEKLKARHEMLEAHERGLVAFIETAKQYAISPPAKTPSKPARQPKQPKDEIRRTNRSARFQPNKFPPQPIPESYESPNRRTRLLKAIIDNFEPESIITAEDINQKIGSYWQIPKGVPARHHFSAVLMHESGPGSILEKVAKGSWRVKPNGLELLQSRVAAEIALAQDEAARRSVQ